MTLATRCPRCHTVFRLSGEHLNQAQGWVRCGACQSVFDGAESACQPDGSPLPVLEPAPAAAPTPASPLPPLQALPDIDLELPDLGSLREPRFEPEPRLAPAPQHDAPHQDPEPDDEPVVHLSPDALAQPEDEAESTAPAEPERPATPEAEPHTEPKADAAPAMGADWQAAQWGGRVAPAPSTGRGPGRGLAWAMAGLGTLGLLAAAAFALFSQRVSLIESSPELWLPLAQAVQAPLAEQGIEVLPAVWAPQRLKVEHARLLPPAEGQGLHRVELTVSADALPGLGVQAPDWTLAWRDEQNNPLGQQVVPANAWSPQRVAWAAGERAVLSTAIDLSASPGAHSITAEAVKR